MSTTRNWGSNTWVRRDMSCKKRTDEGMVNVLRATELRKGKPEYNDRLEKVVEGYASEISVITGKLDSRGEIT